MASAAMSATTLLLARASMVPASVGQCARGSLHGSNLSRIDWRRCTWGSQRGSSSGSGSSAATMRHCCCAAVTRPGSLAADPYVAAALRLESLISGVGDGEEELFANMLLEEDAESKLSVNAAVGAVVLVASAAICWLCGKDPAGGASLSISSLSAAAVGAAAALPLVAYKLLAWSPESHSANPTLATLHSALTNVNRPWLSGMCRRQLGVQLALDTLPLLFLLLPAAQAGLTASWDWSADAIGRATGVTPPESLGVALALVLTGAATAAWRSTEVMADQQQVSVVSDAVANADRFYKLTCSGVDTDAARAARAFKAVAVSWREQEQQVSTLFVTLELIDFLYIGCLWLATQDMTAPCVAALLAGAVDRHFMWLGVGGDGGGRSGRSSKTNALSSSSSSRGGGGGSNSGNSGGGGGGGPSSSSSSTRRE